MKYQRFALIAANSSKTTDSLLKWKDKIMKTYLVKYFHLHLQLHCFWRKLRLTAGKHFTVLASSTFVSPSGGKDSSFCCFLFSSEGEFIGFRASDAGYWATREESQVYKRVVVLQSVLGCWKNISDWIQRRDRGSVGGLKCQFQMSNFEPKFWNLSIEVQVSRIHSWPISRQHPVELGRHSFQCHNTVV